MQWHYLFFFQWHLPYVTLYVNKMLCGCLSYISVTFFFFMRNGFSCFGIKLSPLLECFKLQDFTSCFKQFSLTNHQKCLNSFDICHLFSWVWFKFVLFYCSPVFLAGFLFCLLLVIYPPPFFHYTDFWIIYMPPAYLYLYPPAIVYDSNFKVVAFKCVLLLDFQGKLSCHSLKQ